MNYENLYELMSAEEKNLSSSIKDIQKYFKTITKDTESGDLKDMDKALTSLEAALTQAKEQYQKLGQILNSFDRNAYVNNGDYSKQILAECGAQGIDVRDLGGMTFEMFPNKVTVSKETLDVTIDKKKYSCLRPKALIQTVKSGQEKLKKESFNADRFLNELADAYDIVILKTKKQNKSAEVKLADVYKAMVPMARSKKEYDQQAFAFDLARLYASDVRITRNGRSLSLGTSRDNKNAIRFLDQNGNEQYYAMISFI